jgi:hypothetical protein
MIQPKPHPLLPFHPLKRLKQRRKDMTVCVAALCEHGNHIVMASDSQIGDENISADTPTVNGSGFDHLRKGFSRCQVDESDNRADSGSRGLKDERS